MNLTSLRYSSSSGRDYTGRGEGKDQTCFLHQLPPPSTTIKLTETVLPCLAAVRLRKRTPGAPANARKFPFIGLDSRKPQERKLFASFLENKNDHVNVRRILPIDTQYSSKCQTRPSY